MGEYPPPLPSQIAQQEVSSDDLESQYGSDSTPPAAIRLPQGLPPSIRKSLSQLKSVPLQQAMGSDLERRLYHPAFAYLHAPTPAILPAGVTSDALIEGIYAGLFISAFSKLQKHSLLQHMPLRGRLEKSHEIAAEFVLETFKARTLREDIHLSKGVWPWLLWLAQCRVTDAYRTRRRLSAAETLEPETLPTLHPPPRQPDEPIFKDRADIFDRLRNCPRVRARPLEFALLNRWADQPIGNPDSDLAAMRESFEGLTIKDIYDARRYLMRRAWSLLNVANEFE